MAQYADRPWISPTPPRRPRRPRTLSVILTIDHDASPPTVPPPQEFTILPGATDLAATYRQQI